MSQFQTPLRYPGGKQKLTPFISEILAANEISGHYVEPYAGGAGVAIELLLGRRVEFIHLNDSHRGIYAFWYSVIHYPEALCRLIQSASLTVEEWRKRQRIVYENTTDDLLELGFSIFYLNRCNRSGVLSAGLIGGLNQDGNYKMDARFSRNELIRRVELIALHKEKIHVTNFDAEYYVENYISNLPQNTLIYFDPPYYEKGSDLYLNSYCKSDHERLASIIQNQVQHKWVLSYDGVPPIINLYQAHRHFLYDLQYSAGRSCKGKEIFVFSELIDIPRRSALSNIQLGLLSLEK